MLAGDLRLFYLLWLTAVETSAVAATEPEPLPGLGPVDGALEAFAEFFQLDWDLVQAAAERSATTAAEALSQSDAARQVLAALPDKEKTAWLARLIGDDPHAATELRTLVRDWLEANASANVASLPRRTAGELRARAEAAREVRKQAADRKAEEERNKAAAAAERARRGRLDVLEKRGEAVWREIEAEIARRNPGGYDRATALLQDLKTLAGENDMIMDFSHRLRSIRDRHASKGRFIERLKDLG